MLKDTILGMEEISHAEFEAQHDQAVSHLAHMLREPLSTPKSAEAVRFACDAHLGAMEDV